MVSDFDRFIKMFREGKGMPLNMSFFDQVVAPPLGQLGWFPNVLY